MTHALFLAACFLVCLSISLISGQRVERQRRRDVRRMVIEGNRGLN